MGHRIETLTVPCGCCDGTGRMRLGGVYAETLAVLRRQRHPISGADVGRIMGCSGEAACNRLAALGKYGFATSERYGRERLWAAAPAAALAAD